MANASLMAGKVFNAWATRTFSLIEVIVVNARLSERSAKGYQKLGNLTRTMMQSISHIACQTSAHRDRFIGLGAAPTSVTVTGSVKYDISLSPEHDAKVAALRERFALHATDPVWIQIRRANGADWPALWGAATAGSQFG